MARVLVVEDDSDVRNLICHRLNRTGYIVEGAASGEGALRVLHEREYDLVTLDVNLPGMNGWEVAREMSSAPKLSHIPVVFVSVLEREDAPRDIIIKEWLTKPFTGQQLKRSIENSLTSQGEQGQ